MYGRGVYRTREESRIGFYGDSVELVLGTTRIG